MAMLQSKTHIQPNITIRKISFLCFLKHSSAVRISADIGFGGIEKSFAKCYSRKNQLSGKSGHFPQRNPGQSDFFAPDRYFFENATIPCFENPDLNIEENSYVRLLWHTVLPVDRYSVQLRSALIEEITPRTTLCRFIIFF